MRRRSLLIPCAALLCAAILAAVPSPAAAADTPLKPLAAATDSLPDQPTEKNDRLLAADLLLLEVGIWLPSRLLDVSWANIGLTTMKENLKTGFVWDHDDWLTNQYSHPFHGGLYYNAARSNGYDFWGSVPFALTGSMFWELFMENEPPSINDLLSTTTGGVYFGEQQYRLSSMLLDNTATGAERTWREIGGFLLNPIRGFNRLVTGKTGRVYANPADRLPNAIGGRLTLGTNRVAEGTDLSQARDLYMFDVHFLYGDAFADMSTPKPYETFGMRASLVLHGRAPLIREVSGTGIIWGSKFEHGGDSRSMWAVYQDYDYFDTLVYQFGGQSIGAGLYSWHRRSSVMPIVTNVALHGVVLAGSNVGFETSPGRQYNYSTGAKFKVSTMLLHRRYGRFALRYWLYWFHTLSGADGNEYVHWAQASLNPRVYRDWGLGLDFTYYRRDTHFHDLPETHRKNIELRTFASYTF